MHRRLAQATALATLSLSLLAPSSRAATARFGHTATLLPDGRVFVAGGVVAGAVVGTSEYIDETSGTTTGGLAIVARSSHTATLLANGNVMLAGGHDAAGAALASIQIIDPIADSVVTADVLTTARQGHTATLLSDGRVLICGGVTSARATTPVTFSNTCEIRNADGSSAANVNMLATNGRGWHTATLLRDGRVFITGGFTGSGGEPSPLVTSEIFSCTSATDCSGGLITGGKALSLARGYHQATMMADGRVLITGGYNADDRFVTGHKVGYIESAEIYDPVSDAMTTAAPTLTRLMQHSSTLQPDGSVIVFGGLGNITTTFLTPSLTFESNPASFLDGCFSGACGTYTGNSVASTMTINNVTSQLNTIMNFGLSVPVTGVIMDGEVLFSSPQATIPGGKVNFVYGRERHPTAGNANTGIKIDLQGVPVDCNQAGTCGIINQQLNLSGVSGNYQFDRVDMAPELDAPAGQDDACIRWAGSIDNTTQPPRAISNAGGNCAVQPYGNISYACGNYELPFDRAYLGGSIRFQNVSLLSGAWSWTRPADDISFSADLTAGTGDVTTAQPIAMVADPITGNPEAHFRACFHTLTGTVATSTTTSVSGPAETTVANDSVLSVVMRFNYTIDTVDMGGRAFDVDKATVVIRRMLSQDFQCYTPKTNSWSFSCVPARGQVSGREKSGQTATLLPNGDIHYIGGKSCDSVGQGGCTAFVESTDLGLISTLRSPWSGATSMSRPRGNFTASTLPSGKILLVGGTDGQNVLSDAEVYDPVSDKMNSVAHLNTARDLHTATLLINGRVLVAGGFATTATSTGSTNSAELFYPETGTWLTVAPMARRRDNHTATVTPDGNVVVIGGYQTGAPGGYVGVGEEFNPLTNTWSDLADTLNRPRALHTATYMRDGRIVVIGGVDQNGPLSSVEIWDGATWTEDATDPMPEALHSHGAVQLANGDILVAGGTNGLGEVTSSYRYRPGNPDGTRWINAGRLSNGRMNHTLTLMPNGHAVIAGGAQTSGSTIRGVEIFHESADFWLPISSFSSARAYHTTTIAANGQMMAFGGYGNTGYLQDGERLGFMGTVDGETLLSPSVRQSSITTLSAPTLTRGGTISVTGRNFKGGTEASGGGSASGDSQHYHPRLILQAVDHSGGSSTQGNGGFLLDLSTYVYLQPGFSWTAASGTLTVTLPNTDPAALPYGWYGMRTVNNGVYSDAKMVQAGPALPTGGVSSLNGVVISSEIINFTWSNAGVSNHSGFNIYSGTTGIIIAQVTNPAATSFTQSGLQPNVTAQIIVAPYSLTGDGTLAYSGTFYTFASSPTALSVASVSVTSLELRWDVNKNGPGTVFEVSMSTDNFATAFSTPVPYIAMTTTDHVLVQGLSPNTAYSFRVQAYNFPGFPSSLTTPPNASGFSNVVSTTTRSTVTGLAGTRNGTTSIQWTWTDALINAGAGDRYRVYNSTSGQLIVSTGNPVFVDVGLATNTQRSVMVSVFVNGVGEGPLTSGATAFTDAAVPLAASPAVINVSTGGFTALWTANGNPLNTVYQCVITPLGPVDGLGSGSIAGSTFTTTGFFCAASGLDAPNVPPGSVLDIRVRAVNGDGFGTDAVDPTQLLVIGSTSTLARAPTNLTLVNTTPASISVQWDTNNNASSATYEVTYSTDGFLADVRFAKTFAQGYNLGSITIAGLQTSTTYSIRVRAQNLSLQRTAYSNSLTTGTFNGGAPIGAVGGLILANQQATITGTLGDGRVMTLFIPNNTFPVDTFVAISSHNAAPGPCGAVNVAVQITVTPPIQPLKPVFLTLSYSPAELGAVPVEQAVLQRYDPLSSRCVPLKTTFDTAQQTFTSQLNHFSLFQISQVAPQTNPNFGLIFPNPFYPTRGQGYITFSQLPANTKVHIYTLRGEFAWEGWTNGAGLLTWNAVNTGGRPVASGVYLAVVESAGKKHIYKVAVVR